MFRPSDSPASNLKAELHPKKVLLSVWWDLLGIIHWKILPFNQITNAAFYYLQLDMLYSNLAAKRLDPISCRGVILHHNNVRLHATVITL